MTKHSAGRGHIHYVIVHIVQPDIIYSRTYLGHKNPGSVIKYGVYEDMNHIIQPSQKG